MSKLRKVTCARCGKVANYADENGPAFAEQICECGKSAQIDNAVARFSSLDPGIQRAFIDLVYFGVRPQNVQRMEDIKTAEQPG